MFWHQGANDSSHPDHASQYLTNFQRFIARTRQDLKVTPQQLPVVATPIDFKFLNRQGKLVSPPHIDEVNQALAVRR